MSCRSESKMARTEPIKWIAATRGDFGFISPSLLVQGIPENDGYNPRVHASILEALVLDAAVSIPGAPGSTATRTAQPTPAAISLPDSNGTIFQNFH